VEYKLFTPELKLADEGSGSFQGYGSTFANWDSVRERPVKGAFARHLGDFITSGFIAVGHDWYKLPVASVEDAYEDDYGLFLKAAFHSTPDAQAARTVTTERLARGKSVKLSIGYEVLQDEYVEEGRLLKDIKLYEISLVTVPANNAANVTGAKSIVPDAMPIADYSDAVLALVKEFDRRISQIHEMRAKQGRVLSEANRTRIGSLLEALTAVAADLKTLLAETEPKADPQKARAVYAEFLRLEALANGVTF
jgi:HK97 family phage prohead protease